MTRLNSLIRPQPWVNWLVVCGGAALWGGVVWLGWSIDRSDSGVKSILGLREGRLGRLFGALCLLMVTQLSLVTLWYRTHSRKDFQGQYRLWIWSSLIWGLLFTAAISGWYLSCSARLAARFPSRLEPVVAKTWLLGAMVLVATACRLLGHETVHSRSSHWLLRGGVAVAAITGVLQLLPGGLADGLMLDVRHAAASLWPLLIASALLHHASYVIHVSNEARPWQARGNRLSPIVRQVWAEVVRLGPSRIALKQIFGPANFSRLVAQAWRSISPSRRNGSRHSSKPGGLRTRNPRSRSKTASQQAHD